VASDQLPPHRLYNHKIQLEADHNLGFHLLYKQTAEELLATKQYLLENLGKGFIKHSQALFASPILFVKKPNGGLRFCIDYRKLNAVTWKDQYPLPLIDETLARLSKAKIFTKLDIRQAFHRIRIDLASEDLTTFRTRYGLYKCKVLPFGLTNGLATY
jgi:Reverse transcriptase (RNA-dependent DNA polymerase)